MGDQTGDSIAGIRADAPEQVDRLTALGRVGSSQPLEQMRHSRPTVGAQAEQAVHGLVPDGLVVVLQRGQKQRQHLVAGQANAIQRLESVGDNPGGLLRHKQLGQAPARFARLIHPADGHSGSGANIFFLRAKRLQHLRVRCRAYFPERGTGGFADVIFLVGQQGEQSRHCLVSRRPHVAEHLGRSAANGGAVVAQRVDELRHGSRADPGQGGDHPQPNLIAVTASATAESLDEFRRGLVGGWAKVGQRGG